MAEEKTFTVPLTGAMASPRRKRSARALRLLKEYIQRHVKPERIVITEEVNRLLWAKGIRKPPRSIRVRVVKDKEGVATTHLASEKTSEE